MGTLTQKGQVTIPKAVRDELDLEPGDKIDFAVEHGRLVGRVRRVVPVMELFHRLPGVPAELVDLEAERTAFADAANENEPAGEPST